MERGAKRPYKLNDDLIRLIENCLKNDIRLEVIPTKDGIKVYSVNRKEVKSNN